MLFGRTNIWKLASVQLGEQTINVPVFDRSGTEPGPTLLVTAGSDGDEYTGIEAAYELGTLLATKPFKGRVLILPCLNVPGFFTQESANPLDGRFLKSVEINRASGPPSERLMHWVFSSFAKEATMWIDLHSGALSEKLTPFLWAWPSGKKEVDARIQTYFEAMSNDRIVFDHGHIGGKIRLLARNGCGYILSESGERGERSPQAIRLHLTRITTLMRALGLFQESPIKTKRRSKQFHHITYLQAPYDGIWRPSLSNTNIIKNMEVGSCSRLDQTKIRTLHSPATGTILWSKDTMAMRKGDILLAVAW